MLGSTVNHKICKKGLGRSSGNLYLARIETDFKGAKQLNFEHGHPQYQYSILKCPLQIGYTAKIMGNKLTPKVILEGTRLTFKTEIAFELNEHPRIVGPRKYRYHSPLISAEWCTFTNYPWGRGPINFEPQEESLAMETYATWTKMFELQKYYSWIVDRFHISTIAYQKQTYNKDYDFKWLEERLLPLNFRIIFCTRTPESFEAAREERLKVSGNPSQYDDLSPFIEHQDLMRELVARSMLPSLTLDISDNNIPASVERVADWLEETGGLYMPDQENK